MATLELLLLPRCEPDRFARVEAGLLAGGHPSPVLVVAELAAPALLLGRHQRAASAVDAAAARAAGLPLVRRAGGGRALLAGEGTCALLLFTPPGAWLAPAPFSPDRTANRYVRGLLAALRALGLPGAAYFGRDFVSAGGRQVAVLSQEGTPEGGLAFEAVLAVTRPLAPPPGLLAGPAHSDPRAGGPPHATLAELSGRAPAFEPLAAALAGGWAALHGRELRPAAPLPEAPAPPAEEGEAGLAASGPAEIAIGFAEALAGVAGGRLTGPRLRGDFVAPAWLVAALEAALEGAPLDLGEVGRRIDAAFHRPGAFLLGVRGLGTFADRVLAAGRAAARRAASV
jgi:lipoate-protein ligase A